MSRGDDAVRSAVAGALSGVARALSAGARLTDRASLRLRPAPSAAEPPDTAGSADVTTIGDVVEEVDAQRAGTLPPSVLSDEGPDRARKAESAAAELADGTVAEITERIPDLSTDELRALLEYEEAHKGRVTVLRAVERALTPDEDS